MYFIQRNKTIRITKFSLLSSPISLKITFYWPALDAGTAALDAETDALDAETDALDAETDTLDALIYASEETEYSALNSS